MTDLDSRGPPSSFNFDRYLADLAATLIRDFEQSAQTTHPGVKGTVKETRSREKLGALLPAAVGVGQGFVIDSSGGVSRQTDLVLFEKHLCPQFDLGAPEATYYPCEGVVAVGEVKTALGKKGLADAYEKIRVVKSLRRRSFRHSFRKYGSTTAITGEGSPGILGPACTQFQILGFVLCESLGMLPDTALAHVVEFDAAAPGTLRPNLIVSLKEGAIVRVRRAENRLVLGAQDGDAVAFVPLDRLSFPFLVRQLLHHIAQGHTTCEPPLLSYLGQFDSLALRGLADSPP